MNSSFNIIHLEHNKSHFSQKLFFKLYPKSITEELWQLFVFIIL